MTEKYFKTHFFFWNNINYFLKLSAWSQTELCAVIQNHCVEGRRHYRLDLPQWKCGKPWSQETYQTDSVCLMAQGKEWEYNISGLCNYTINTQELEKLFFFYLKTNKQKNSSTCIESMLTTDRQDFFPSLFLKFPFLYGIFPPMKVPKQKYPEAVAQGGISLQCLLLCCFTNLSSTVSIWKIYINTYLGLRDAVGCM